jgi:hypothetical protein
MSAISYRIARSKGEAGNERHEHKAPYRWTTSGVWSLQARQPLIAARK